MEHPGLAVGRRARVTASPPGSQAMISSQRSISRLRKCISIKRAWGAGRGESASPSSVIPRYPAACTRVSQRAAIARAGPAAFPKPEGGPRGRDPHHLSGAVAGIHAQNKAPTLERTVSRLHEASTGRSPENFESTPRFEVESRSCRGQSAYGIQREVSLDGAAVNECETSSRSRPAARDARTRFSSTSRGLELALPPQPIADVPESDRRPLRIVGYWIEKTIRPAASVAPSKHSINRNPWSTAK